MKTYEITEEQIKEAHGAACSQWKLKIEQWWPDVFKSKLEVGKWYKRNNSNNVIAFIKEIHADDFTAYGWDYNGLWVNDSDNWTCDLDDWTPATDKEVEEMLIKEAVRRGYEGKSIKSLIDDGLLVNETNDGKYISDVTYSYYANKNSLYLGYMVIFKNGKWAEIIKEEPSKEMTIEEIESKLGHKIKIVK